MNKDLQDAQGPDELSSETEAAGSPASSALPAYMRGDEAEDGIAAERPAHETALAREGIPDIAEADAGAAIAVEPDGTAHAPEAADQGVAEEDAARPKHDFAAPAEAIDDFFATPARAAKPGAAGGAMPGATPEAEADATSREAADSGLKSNAEAWSYTRPGTSTATPAADKEATTQRPAASPLGAAAGAEAKSRATQPSASPFEAVKKSAQSEATQAAGADPKPGQKAEVIKGAFGRFGKKDKKTTAKAPQPKISRTPFGKNHPVLGVEQTLPQSVGSGMFNAMALLPFLPLTLMLLLQTVFCLDARALWIPEEVLYADAFKNQLTGLHGLLPAVNGADWTNMPPLYFWFLRGLHLILPTEGLMLHMAGVALSGLVYLWAALLFGRQAARVDGRTNLAAGILLLSSACLLGLTHYATADLLFAALVVLSCLFLYRALVSQAQAVGGMVAAFVLAGAACLVKGLLGLALPLTAALLFALWRGNREQWRCILLSSAALVFGLLPAFAGLYLAGLAGLVPADAQSLPPALGLAAVGLPALVLAALAAFMPRLRLCAALSLLLMAAAFALTGGLLPFVWPAHYALPALLAALFVLWQVTPQRLFRADFFIGLAAGLVTAGLWIAAMYLQNGNLDQTLDVLRSYLPQQILTAWQSSGDSLGALCLLPLILLPWTLLLVCLPWQRLPGKALRESLAASRRPEKEGLAFVWCLILASLALFLGFGGGLRQYLLPALPALALVAARAILALDGKRAPLFRYGTAAILLLSGFVSILGALMLFDILPMPGFIGLPEWKLASQGGFFLVGAILLVGGALMWFGLSSPRPEGVLLVAALTATGLGFPLGGMSLPGFDAAFSPQNQALLMRAYRDNNYTIASLQTPGDVYAFYSGGAVRALSSPEAAAELAQAGQLALAVPVSVLDAWADKPECLTEVQRQWLGREQVALLACPAIQDLAPGPLPYAAGPDLLEEARKHLDIDLGAKKDAAATNGTAAEDASDARLVKDAATEDAGAAEPVDKDAPTQDSGPKETGTEDADKADAAAQEADPGQTPADPAASDVPKTPEATEDLPAAPRDNGQAPEHDTPPDMQPGAQPAAHKEAPDDKTPEPAASPETNTDAHAPESPSASGAPASESTAGDNAPQDPSSPAASPDAQAPPSKAAPGDTAPQDAASPAAPDAQAPAADAPDADSPEAGGPGRENSAPPAQGDETQPDTHAPAPADENTAPQEEQPAQAEPGAV